MRGGKYMGVTQSSRTEGRLGAYLQGRVWQEQARELRDGPGLKG